MDGGDDDAAMMMVVYCYHHHHPPILIYNLEADLQQNLASSLRFNHHHHHPTFIVSEGSLFQHPIDRTELPEQVLRVVFEVLPH